MASVDLLQDFVNELEASELSCAHHPVDLPPPSSIEEAAQYWEWFKHCKPERRARHLRWFALNDLYFLGRYILEWHYAEHPWQFERAREVQADPDGYLDLWSRGHMKSHWVTFALTIQNVLNDPNVTIGIFSHTRPIAKAFLRVIKQIFQTNDLLKSLFPEILWQNPENEAPKWSEDEGIVVKRRAVRLEQTIEAWGLDAQPTSRHFDVLVFDDVVTVENSGSVDRMKATTNNWEIAQNLSMPTTRQRHVGTFYHELDTYHAIIEKGAVKVRRYPIFYEDGPMKGQPVFFSVEEAEKKRRDNGPRNFAFQCLLNPKADTTKERWDMAWVRQRENIKFASGFNVYIIVDPANEQKKDSDWTTIGAIGLAADRTYHLLDLVRDRLTLKGRTDALFEMHQKFAALGVGMKPKAVGYEKYGKDSDIAHIEEKMADNNYRFNITPLAGRLSKVDRINGLQPSFQELRWYFPLSIYRALYDGKRVELITEFIQDEYSFWPDPKHDDVLDMLARILDPKLGTMFPIGDFAKARQGRNDYPDVERKPASWMGAW